MFLFKCCIPRTHYTPLSSSLESPRAAASDSLAASTLLTIQRNPAAHVSSLPALLQALNTTKDAGALLQLTAALGSLAAFPQTHSQILESLEMLVDVMADVPETRANLCGVFTNLASDSDARREIPESVVPVLLEMIQSRDSRVVRNAIAALLNLTHESTGVRLRPVVVEKDGVRILVHSMETWKTQDEIVHYAVTTLSNLFVDEVSRARLWVDAELRQETVGVLVSCLENRDEFRKDSFVSLGASRSKLRAQALFCLRNLASDEEFQQLILQSGVLNGVVECIEEGLAGPAAALLRNLSISEENEDELIDAHVPEFVLEKLIAVNQPVVGSDVDSVFSVGVNEVELKHHYASVLRNLVSNSRGADAFLAVDGIEKLKTVLHGVSTTAEGIEYSAEVQALIAVLAMHDPARWKIIADSHSGDSLLDLVVALENPLGCATVFSNLFATTFSSEEKERVKTWVDERWDLFERVFKVWMSSDEGRDTAQFFAGVLAEYGKSAEALLSRQ